MNPDNRPRAGSPPAEEAGSLISAVYGRPSSILNPPIMPPPVIHQPLLESALLPPIVPPRMIPQQLPAPSMYPPTMMPPHMVAQAEYAEKESRRLRREERQRQFSAYEKKKEEARKKGLYLVDAEDDGLNERGIPRGPPKTPPGDPPPVGIAPEMHHHIQHQEMMMPPQIRSNLIVIPPEEFDDVSDDSDEPPPKREPIGPRTPPDDGFMPPLPQAQAPKPASDGELSGDDSESVAKSGKSSEKKKKAKHTDVHLKRSQIFSPLRRLYQHRDVQPRKRRSDEEKKPEIDKPDNSRELTFPTYATKKCLELLEFTEKKGLTITDDELYEVVREGIELDQAMERILEKKELMKETMERLRDSEMDRIKRIHSNMPRHMQDVIKFDGKTVHINQESVPPAPPTQFGTSSLMSLKYPPSQHMGVPPPGFPPQFAPSIGVPPPSMGMPPPPMGVGAPPPFAMPPPASLLGPPPFGMQPPHHGGNSGPIAPPVIQPVAPPPSIMSENEKRNMITHGLNPLAFSNQPDFGMPPALKKPGGPQDPQVIRVTNNLSNMLTNALKAQVSKSQSSLATGSPSGTPTKKPVPSLMSINIPGIPKSGTPGSSKN